VSQGHMRRALVPLALLGLAACPAPADVTPLIHVDPRAAQRLGWFGNAPPPAEPAGPSPARVHAMKDGEQLGGAGATGRPGDLVLENAEVTFVVDQRGSTAGLPGSGGHLVDAADAHARKDELGKMFASVGARSAGVEGVCEAVTAGQGADGSAWIETRERDSAEGRLSLVTRYTLHAPDRALLVESTVENTGDTAVELPSLGDVIEWGAAEKVAPGKPRGFVGATRGPYVGAVGRSVSYAVTSTEGSLDAVSGASSTRTSVRESVPLAPHEKTTYARVFVVGARPDTSSLVAELTLAAGQPVGAVKLAVPGGAAGTRIEVTPEGSTEPLTIAEPFEATLPLGRYWITPREGTGRIGPLDVKAEGVAEATVPGALR
jgi:hypothetical protein